MDLSKFVALLQRRVLVFARADKLGDPFEGSVPLGNAAALTLIKEIRKSDPGKDPYSGMPCETLEKVFTQFSDIRKRAVQAFFISCWHMNQGESAAMWKLYSTSDDAVCVRTDYATLASVLPDEICMGIINYIDYKTATIRGDNLFNPVLIKRRSFAHEREARAVALDFDVLLRGTSPPHIREVPIDVDKLITAVYVSPKSPEWFRGVVEKLANKYDLTVPVERSEIDSEPLY